MKIDDIVKLKEDTLYQNPSEMFNEDAYAVVVEVCEDTGLAKIRPELQDQQFVFFDDVEVITPQKAVQELNTVMRLLGQIQDMQERIDVYEDAMGN